MRSRRPGVRFAVAVAFVAAIAFTTWYLLPHSDPSSPAVAGLLGRVPAETALSRWVSTGKGAGGFQTGQSSPSLYQTAWQLRLQAFYGLPLPDQIDRAQLVRWLQGVVVDPDPSNLSSAGLPSLEIARLAAQALVDLGEPVPAGAAQVASAAERDGAGYAFRTGEAPTWAAASTATQLLLMLHETPASGLRAALVRDLPGLTRDASSTTEVAGELIAAWTIADSVLPVSVRGQWQGLLEEKLRPTWAELTSTPPSSGEVFAVLAVIQQVAQDNSVTLPPVGASFFVPTTLANGYIALHGLPDPQVTYQAAVLGRAMTPAIVETFTSSANASGWSNASDGPDPEASYRAIAVLHAQGDAGKDEAMRQQADAWLAEIATRATRQSTAPGQVRAIFFVLALERELGAPDGDLVAVLHAVEEGMDGWSTADLGWAARGDVLLGVPSSANAGKGLTAMAAQASSTMGQAFQLLLACREGVTDACGRMAGAAETFRVPDGGFRWSTESAEPDLRSTAMAAAILGQAPAADVLERFATPVGPSLYPASHVGPNLADVDTAFFMLAAVSPDQYGWAIP